MRGAVQKGNVALITNGAKVSGVNTWPEKMINPAATGEATSFGPTPCEFIITLDKPYQLQQIRFLIQAKTTAMYQILLFSRRAEVRRAGRSQPSKTKRLAGIPIPASAREGHQAGGRGAAR